MNGGVCIYIYNRERERGGGGGGGGGGGRESVYSIITHCYSSQWSFRQCYLIAPRLYVNTYCLWATIPVHEMLINWNSTDIKFSKEFTSKTFPSIPLVMLSNCFLETSAPIPMARTVIFWECSFFAISAKGSIGTPFPTVCFPSVITTAT